MVDDSGVLGISIHAPLTGSDHIVFFSIMAVKLFQSTLPLRGATVTFGVIRIIK